MIKLVFSKGTEIFNIEIINREVFYKDRKMGRTRLIPRDPQIDKLVLMSRNRIPKDVINFYDLTISEKEEYDSCKDEEEIAEFCITDSVVKNHCKLQKKEVI